MESARPTPADEIQKKRDYYRRWRAEHRDKVRAAQMRYWQRQAEEMASNTGSGPGDQDQEPGQNRNDEGR